MIAIVIIGWIVWITGVYAAWFQIDLWCTEKSIPPEKSQAKIMLCLLSWVIYPVYLIAWLYDKYNKD